MNIPTFESISNLIDTHGEPIDCIIKDDALNVLRGLSDESIDLVVTDPPYKITSRGNHGSTGGMLKNDLSMKGKIFKHNNIKFEEYLPELFRVLKNGSHCYIMTNHINLINLLNTSKNTGFHFIKCLIWDKGNKIMGQYYMSQYEYIVFLRKGKAVRINNCGTSDIISAPNKKMKDSNGKNLHDTEKPVELMKVLIGNSAKKGDLVLDPFTGIGSTALACQSLNINFIGSEIDENYHRIATERVLDANNTTQLSLL